MRTQISLTDQLDVMVVDARPEDYGRLAAACAARNVRFQFASTISDGLRLWRRAGRSIWLVNLELPDGAGCDLAAAIRTRDRASIVYLVGDTYDPGEEIAARMTAGALYVCKPADLAWLDLADPQPTSLGRCA
jgi:DNA-binding response OmpR family regulator